MTQRIVRLSIVGLAAALMLAAMTGCFFGGEEEPEPTEAPDLAATIAAAVSAATPTDTPVPPTDTPVPPTNTPVPPTNTPEPTPDIQATIDASIAATRAAMPQPTATPLPTNTPPPTNTPVPTAIAPARQPSDGPPCIVAGKVTIGGVVPPAGTPVYARSQRGDGQVVAEDGTNQDGTYQLGILYYNEAFDIFVRVQDSGVDTPVTFRGCREIRNLTIP